MNKFKKLSAIIFAVCTLSAMMTSCGNNSETSDSALSSVNSITEEHQTVIVTNDNGETEIETVRSDKKTEIQNTPNETVTKKEIVTVNVTDKKGNTSVSASEKVIVVPVATSKQSSASVNNNLHSASATKSQTKPKITTTKAPTTKKPVINDTINENAVGISLLSKSDPVKCGNHASIIIQGTPGKTYSIDFYKSPSEPANYSALKDTKADANGFVSWSFKITDSCTLGKRKVIIKEIGSSNYIETSITVK